MATKKLVRKSAAPVSKTVSKSVSKNVPAASNGDEDETQDSAIRPGWTAAQETADSTSAFAQAFKVSTKTQLVKFLQDRPYASFRRHWIDRVNVGKRAYTCLQSFNKPCPLCDIGDKATGVTAFNIALVGDDSEATLKTWDCGVLIMQTLRNYANDPKIGPLNKDGLYFGVSKTESAQRGRTQTNVNPLRGRDLEEDYGIKPLSEAAIARLLEKAYDADIVPVSRRSELEEIAAEMINEDSEGGGQQQQRGRRASQWDSED